MDMKSRYRGANLALLAVALTFLLAPCSARADGPSAVINILTDVAQRYLNNSSLGRNFTVSDLSRRLLQPGSDRATSAAQAYGSGPPPVQQPSSGQTASFSVALSRKELSFLGDHDVDILIDKSKSMATVDCLSAAGDSPLAAILSGWPKRNNGQLVSRWDWCRQQSLDFSRQTANVLANGVEIVPFSSKFNIYKHCGAADVAEVFADNRPDGGTNLAPALKKELDDYFARRDANAGAVKPLVVAIITDGAPSSTSAVRREIIEASSKMKSADEITIVFLQIGHDPDGVRFLQDVSSDEFLQSIAYRIVRIKSFEELQQTGLGRALVDAATLSPADSRISAGSN